MDLVAVDIVALIEEEKDQSPVVVLHDKKSDRVLPIWIGETEARAIAVALNKVIPPRPLTHNLLLNTVAQLGYSLSKIIIDRAQQHTYFATMYIRRENQEIGIDARPSDSIALALTANVPIFVTQEIMDKAGEKNPFSAVPGPLQQPIQQSGPRKIELSKQDLNRVSEMLKKAQDREERSL